MELCQPVSLSRHFALRLKQYLLFLEVTNDHELIQLLLSFLPLKDLLHFLTVSTHFAALKRLQSVQLRILRAKLAFLEKPDEPLVWNPILHFLPIMMAQPVPTKTHKIQNNQQGLIKFLQQVRSFKNNKRKALSDGKEAKLKVHGKKTHTEFDKFYQQLNDEGKRLEEKLNVQPEGWGKLSQNEEMLKQFQHIVQAQSEKSVPAARRPFQKPKSAPISPLDLLEHHHARIDYERRKARKMQEKQDFIPVQQFKRLAEQDPCSRQVFNSIYDTEKAREQQRNVAKLKMGPSPDPSKFHLEAVEVKVKKQSIAGKMVSGIKSLLIDRQS